MKRSSKALSENRINQNSSFLNNTLKRTIAHSSECLWAAVTFVLFLIMGPFSAIAVAIGLWNLTNSEYSRHMTEPAP